MTDHNTMREGHLHDDRKSYGSEPEAMFPFPGEAAGHKNGPMLHRKDMRQSVPVFASQMVEIREILQWSAKKLGFGILTYESAS